MNPSNRHTRESILAIPYPEPNSGCWLWDGKIMKNGYGTVNFNGKRWFAHRLVFTLERGPIPDGLMMDHLCRNRGCVNPDHLEPVTPQVNTRRGLKFKNVGGLCHECGRKLPNHDSGCAPCAKRRYRARHPERVAAAAAASWARHREKRIEYLRARRAKKKEERTHEQQ